MTEEPRLLGGRYELGGVLGRGGMAEVRRARDLRLSRDVAVKQLRVDLATDPTFQARFRREAQSSAGLNHPNIVSVYDTGEEPDPATKVSVPYIVMELVEGHTLREILRTGRQIQPSKALEFAQGVLEALDYSHKAGIVHRDIKPANVMLTPNGTVKVMDFGIARAVADTSATMTQTAAVIGTAQYLSPEQARGETVDSRSDIYSAGCLLYELLVGRPPFQGDSPVSVAYQHVREAPVPPSHLDGMISPAMDAIVLKALSKDPADRYQTAAAMRADIGRLLAGEEVRAALPTPGPTVEATVLQASPPPPPLMTDTATQPGARALVPEPKRRVGLWAFLIALGVLAASVGLYFLFNHLNRVETVVVPLVSGQRVADARQILTTAGLVPQVATWQGPDDDTVNRVTKQSVMANTKVPVGTEVVIEVNVGPQKQTIPSGLTGQQLSEVQRILSEAGFTSVTPAEDPNEPLTAAPNEVTSVNPVEGNSVPLTTEIVVYYAVGKSIVPNMRGISEQEARDLAAASGFKKIKVITQESTATPGTIVDQTPGAGSSVKRTTTITLVKAVAPPVVTPTESASPTASETPSETTTPE